MNEIELYDIVIIGGGPAGMTAGLYAGRALMKAILIDQGALGGTVLMTPRYENFPSYPGGIESFELAQRLERHMKEYGIKVEMDKVTSLRFWNGGPFFEVVGESGTYRAKSVIVATGSTPKMLDAPGAKEFFGKGVSICADCDGAFYRGKHVAVIGGGDSAVEEAIFLTKFADSVTIIHRRDQFRANPLSSKEAVEHPKIRVMWDSVVKEILGAGKVEKLKVKNVKTGELSEVRVDGVFIYIGSYGNSGFIELDVERNPDGYIKAGASGETSVPGLFAAGDVVDFPFKQAIIACGQGAIAALSAGKYVSSIHPETLEKYTGK